MLTLHELLKELKDLESHVVETTATWECHLTGTDERYRYSARNLLRYIALRQKDLRKLQIALGAMGLSLSQCERHVLRNLREVIARLESSLVKPTNADTADTISWEEAKHLLHQHSRAVFGSPVADTPPTELHQAIMVTSDEHIDHDFARTLQNAGAQVLRINGAHGTQDQWRAQADAWRSAALEAENRVHPARVLFDIAGPKLRTGRVAMPSPVLRLKIEKAYDGHVIAPLLINLHKADSLRITRSDWWLPLDTMPQEGDSIAFVDLRGRSRRFVVKGSETGAALAIDRGCYLGIGIELQYKKDTGNAVRFVIEDLLDAEEVVYVEPGDEILLVSSDDFVATGRKEIQVECLEIPLLEQLVPDEVVSFDDGRISCRVLERCENGVRLRVVTTTKPRTSLKRDKGINTPGFSPKVPLLNEEDLQALSFAIEHADIVSFSFVRNVADIDTIFATLSSFGAPKDLPVVLKIETAEAFAKLPSIILSAMRHYPVSIMIARGDLAVEVGCIRSGEVQEQILSLTEAAHVPVILATEVFGRLLKTGSPSRAEVTDAAMSVRAECVMLNKGPFLLEATESLRDILLRMQTHRYKNLEIFRPTSWSHSLNECGIPGPT